MTNSLLELTEDEFDVKYPLIENHLNPNASWSIGAGAGCLFETFGDELAFVRRQDPATVWTVVDGEDGDLYITSGFHFVNRLGYLVSTEAVPAGVQVQVCIPMQAEPGEAPGEPEAGRFPLGQLVITSNASLRLAIEEVLTALERHAAADWGCLCPEDTLANEIALEEGGRLFSAYGEGATRFWIITEADRSVTTVLLPNDY